MLVLDYKILHMKYKYLECIGYNHDDVGLHR